MHPSDRTFLSEDTHLRFPILVMDGSDSKVSACNAGDLGSIPGLG